MVVRATLYRVVDANDSFDDVEDENKLEMGDTATIPANSRTDIISIHPMLSRHNADNPLPHQNESNRPDTGFSGNRYRLELYFDESVGRAAGIAWIVNVMSGEQTVDEELDEGNIGLANTLRPEFNLHPSATAGYKIVSFSIDQVVKYNHMVRGTLILELSGNPSELG